MATWATRAGFARSVRVAAHAEPGPGTALRFSVSDTGIGIAPDVREHVFGAFTQADVSTTRQYGGTGLGLAISANLVRLMGGRLWIDDDPEPGTTFHFTVRLAEDETAAAEAVVSHPDLLENLPVLAVDDNETNRVILETMLRGWGMAPSVVDRAEAALDEARRAHAAGTPYQLVISDYHMPVMDGLGLAQQIREDADLGHLPFLLLSSGMAAGTHERAQALGVSARMLKPVKQSELFDAILRAISQTRRRVPRDAGEDTRIAPAPEDALHV
ncbi:MAG: ATP-binding response regulator, partial [Planctomycetota bacterium]